MTTDEMIKELHGAIIGKNYPKHDLIHTAKKVVEIRFDSTKE